LLIGLRQAAPVHADPPGDWRFYYPFTLAERSLFIFVAISAGFCEEVVFRGFAISALKQRGWKTWQAVLLATLSFIGIHGIAGIFLSPFLFVAGLFYAGLFLWRRNLTLAIYVHTLFDLMSVAAV
jgi:membrane protease YdiL (CAAX protease family)